MPSQEPLAGDPGQVAFSMYGLLSPEQPAGLVSSVVIYEEILLQAMGGACYEEELQEGPRGRSPLGEPGPGEACEDSAPAGPRDRTLVNGIKPISCYYLEMLLHSCTPPGSKWSVGAVPAHPASKTALLLTLHFTLVTGHCPLLPLQTGPHPCPQRQGSSASRSAHLGSSQVWQALGGPDPTD